MAGNNAAQLYTTPPKPSCNRRRRASQMEEEGCTSRQSVKRKDPGETHSARAGEGEGEEIEVRPDLSSIPPFDFMGSEMLPICPRCTLLFFN